MRRFRSFVLVAIACISARTLKSQVIGTNLEIFGNAGFVGGGAPLVMNGNDRALLYGGAMGNVGLQFQHIAAGIGVRYCQFLATQDLGGGMLDGFLLAEIRGERASRTALRLGWGVGQDIFDTGKSGGATIVQPNVDTWMVGVGHELPTVGAARFLVTVDLLVPQSEAASVHRRGVGIELGLSYRGRTYQPIRTLPGGRP